MTAYAVFDVEIRDSARYRDLMKQVKPMVETSRAQYLEGVEG